MNTVMLIPAIPPHKAAPMARSMIPQISINKAWAFILLAFFPIFSASSAYGDGRKNIETAIYDHLLKAYPAHLDRVENGILLWKDGTKMPLNTRLQGNIPPFSAKNRENLQFHLKNPSLASQLALPYLQGRPLSPPARNDDPGRVRYTPFFNKIYGNCKKGEVSKALVNVVWKSNNRAKNIKFSKINGAARQLQKVADELNALPQEFHKYLWPISGTYNCRKIAGTNRFSTHSYGIAIDLNAKQADYWRWSKPNKAGLRPYKNRVPWEIVAIFEKHGFIWGGKWYHYDSMHFEYRPELIR